MSTFCPFHFFFLAIIVGAMSCCEWTRVADPHTSNAVPDPELAFHLNEDPDPALHFKADPDPDPDHQSYANLRSLFYRSSTSPFWVFEVLEFRLSCGSGSSFHSSAIRIWIGIQLPNIMRIKADPDPQHWNKHTRSNQDTISRIWKRHHWLILCRTTWIPATLLCVCSRTGQFSTPCAAILFSTVKATFTFSPSTRPCAHSL